MGKNGFGKSAPRTRDAKKFMRAFMDCVIEAKGNETKIHQFLKSNKAKLDESLLDALPLVFASLTSDQLMNGREAIAPFFGTFGNSIRQFPLGNRMLNLELSIAAYHLALNVYTRKAFPEEWAATQNNLGNAYCERLHGERAENLEKAITAYELALQVRTREAFPKDWAMTQNNLGNAYLNRIRGERAENLEKAITAYELALQVRTREAFPEDWAATQNNLGNAYGNRLRGERAENLEKAIIAFELALQVRTREAFPEDWAGTQGNLAGVLMQRASLTDNFIDLDNAITLLQSALEVSASGSPTFINIQSSLGNAFSRRGCDPYLISLESNRKTILVELVPELIPSSWR
jgi:tetratricopeptide (TPR) repeat protein